MATTSGLRAAIIGTGRIASLLERDPLRTKPHTHAGWYASHPGTMLVAGCDVDPERLAEFGRDWGVSPGHLYAEYEAMLARERPDIVSVCAYAQDRVAMCRAALGAGAHGLWIEKAIACSVDEARALAVDLAASSAAAIVDHPRRYDARYRSVARWVADETFGRLETVHVLFSGHVIHTGTHAWDLLLAWCGPWAHVESSLDAPEGDDASGDRRRTEVGDRHADRHAQARRAGHADRGGRARIVFANGVEAFVTGGAKQYFVFQCDLVCAGGRVRIGNDVWDVLEPADSPRYSGFRELVSVDPALHQRDEDRPPQPLLDDLLSAMVHRRAPIASVASAIDALALGVAIMQAGITGRVVTPDTLDTSLRIASV